MVNLAKSSWLTSYGNTESQFLNLHVLLGSLLCVEYIHTESVIWEQPFTPRLIYSLVLITWVHRAKTCNVTRLLSGDFSFCSSPLSSPVSTNPFFVSIVKRDRTWSRTEQNLNEMSSHSLLGMSVPHLIQYFRLACDKVAINIGNTFKAEMFEWLDCFSAVPPSAEYNRCGYTPHGFILCVRVAMAWSKMLGRITVSNYGDDDVSLLFGWLPCTGVVGSWKHLVYGSDKIQTRIRVNKEL